MKKRFNLYFITVLLLSGCNGCSCNQKKGGNSALGTVSYIYVCDSVTNEMIKAFDPIMKSLTQDQPDTRDTINFLVYTTRTTGHRGPAMATFAKDDLKSARKKQRKAFVDSLTKMEQINPSSDKSILHSLEQVFDGTNGNGDYRIIIVSDLLENAGEPNVSENTEGWMNGYFRFLNGDSGVKDDELKAARRSLSADSGWIYRHLIATGAETPVTKPTNLSVTVYWKKPLIMKTKKSTYDEMDVLSFWVDLFKKMKIKATFVTAPYKMNINLQ